MKELLLLLCRYPFDQKNRELLSNLLCEVQNWHEMVKLINDHGIIALAAYNIKESGLENRIPSDTMAILEKGYLQSVVRNTWLTERWKEVNTILNKASIKHILLKGMALEHTIYGAKGLRQMNDNDILVKREDAFKAWDLLQQKGYTTELIKSPLYKKILPDIGKHMPTLYKDGYSIEIHHKLSDIKLPNGKSYSDPVDTAVEIQIGDTKALILSTDLQLFHLISHFEKHVIDGNCQLRLYADIRLIDESSNLKMPDRFILNPRQEMNWKQRMAAYKANIKSVPNIHRLRFIIGDIFPSVKWMKNRYNCTDAKAILHYPARFGKLLWLI